MEKYFLDRKNSALLVIDVQEKFLPHIQNHEELIKNIGILEEAACKLEIPIIMTEQYPKGLGKTEKSLLQRSDSEPIEKDTFSCCGENNVVETLGLTKRSHIVVTGIESHVCVHQTVLDLLKDDYHVHVVSDGVGSRHKKNRKTAIALMREAGAVITCMETVIFQWLERSGTKEFKDIQPLLK